MSNQKIKAYALSISVKPTSTLFDKNSKYKAISFKGIALARNPKEAEELSVNIVLNSFKGYDGSSISKPLVARENITVKECRLYGDFLAKETSKSE